MLFVGTSIIHPSTEGVFLLCNILDLLIYSYYFWGNKWLTYPVAGGLYGEEKETNKQQNYDGDHSNYYGFLYDYSDKEAEYTACLNIVEEYKKSLWVGAADVDTTLAEMTKRLKAAGMDDLIQAKQEQLDAWMSSK